MLSTLCAIHCLAMPLVAATLPFWGLGIIASRGWEQTTSVIMIVLAGWCLWQGCRRHQRWDLFALLVVGGGIVLGTQFFWPGANPDACCAERANWGEATLMFLGGTTIATAHLLNLHFRNTCRCRYCPGAEAERPAAAGTTPLERR